MIALTVRDRVVPLLTCAVLAVGCAPPDVQQSEWTLTAPASGTTLSLAVSAGNTCFDYDRVDVEQTSDTVHIRAFVEHNGDSGCGDLLEVERVTVELAEHLGDRRLLGCADEDVEVGGLRWDGDEDCRHVYPR